MTDDRPVGAADASDERLVPIGRISAAHGVRGWLRMHVFGDGADALRPGVALHVTEPKGAKHVFEIRQVTSGRKGGEARIALDGVPDRSAAEALRGAGVAVAAAELGAAGDGEVWVHDLIGCRVASEAGEEIGEIRGLWEAGASDVLVVAAPAGREHLVPAAFLRDIDLVARRVVVEVLPGLLGDADGEGATEADAPEED